MPMIPSYRNVHSRFKLNGTSFLREELKEVAYSLIKEGRPFEKDIGDFLLDWLDDSTIVEVHTSGSTGKPKCITLQKRHMVNSALATGDFFELEPGDAALLCLPATYIAGKMMLVRALVLGLELDCVVPSSNPLAERPKSFDFVAMVPLQLENSTSKLERVKTLIVGGAVLSGAIIHRLRKLDATLGPNVYETYGMTETITHIALRKIDCEFDENFRTLPNVAVSVDDRGCLVIDAPRINDTPVVTNDRVHLISKTEFKWLGRYDTVINSGGIKLFPEQIEAKLRSIISARFFVAGLPDEKLGQRLVLVVEGDAEDENVLEQLQSLNTLKKFEVPKEIYSVARFDETDSGKVQRENTLALLGV